MKRVFLGVLTLWLLSITAACSTAQGLWGSITGGEGSSKNSLISKLSPDYNLPKSYDAAYSYRTDTPDEDMRNVSQDIEALRVNNTVEYVRRVSALINASAKNDFEKVKKIHDLLALLIKYDAANSQAGTIPSQSYLNVLKTRLAVSEGYSNTFQRFCDELKIPSEIVHGYGRGDGSSPLAIETPGNSNHTWNIVTINGENYLVDCAWDSGNIDGAASKQQYTTDWLFLKPEQFLYAHYPKNAKHQLLATPLSAEQFSALPFFKPKFFELADNLSVNLQKIQKAGNALSFDYTAKPGHWFTFKIHDIKTGKEMQNRHFVQNLGSKQRSFFSFPAAGQYGINIYWWKSGANNGEPCGEFIVEAASGNTVEYPAVYPSSAQNLQLISPVEMPLQKGAGYDFTIRVDNKNVAAVIYGATFVPLPKNAEGLFTANIEIPNTISELSIGLADAAGGKYDIVAKYTVK